MIRESSCVKVELKAYTSDAEKGKDQRSVCRHMGASPDWSTREAGANYFKRVP